MQVLKKYNEKPLNQSVMHFTGKEISHFYKAKHI